MGAPGGSDLPVANRDRDREVAATGTLVFDLDGTLSDPFDGIWRSVNHALDRHRHARVSRDAFRPFIGPPLELIFETLAPGADAAAVESLVAAYRERYGREGYAENVLYPGTRRLLDDLTSAEFRCGLCTSKRRDFAVQVLDLFDLTPYFDFIAGGDVGVSKADQLAALLAEGRIDGDAVMIGDRAIDVEAAAANGLCGVGVAWGFGSREELEQAAPWAIADTPERLFELLTGRRAPSASP